MHGQYISTTGWLAFRQEHERLVSPVLLAIEKLAMKEIARGFPHRGPISTEQKLERVAILQDVSHTKAIAQGVISALADEASKGLPVIRIHSLDFPAMPPSPPDARPYGSSPIRKLVYDNFQHDAESGVLGNVLRWVLNSASPEPFARYNMEIRQKIHGKDNLLDGRYVLVTREGVHEFDSSARCDAKAIQLGKAHREMLAAGRDGSAPEPGPSPSA
ncbi:hypothetical protein [Alcanivorax sp. 1008]|uniref:hypothetical protein n=1 Tax=Alcanivorax sp. 1008 TaxID=2816853 RepID=UPI001D77120F|nr:hypothetical protein [Alcanivorax sp. 1008]MCC1496875.1 hypothetical protein [Alcanivorax sp. 1008]